MKTPVMLVAVATAVFAGCVAMAQPALAKEPPPIPDDVNAWLRTQGPQILKSQSLAGPHDVAPSDGPLLFPFNSSLGKPVAVMVWGDEFLRAPNPTADLLVPRGDWIVPITAKGQPVGTFIVDRLADGSLSWSASEDAEAAAVLLGVKPGDIVASDARNGLFLVTGNLARQSGHARVGIAAATGTLRQLQAALLSQKADDDAANAAAKASGLDDGGYLTGGATLDFGAWVRGHPDPDMPNIPAVVTGSPWRVAGPVVGALLGVLAIIGLVGAHLARVYHREAALE